MSVTGSGLSDSGIDRALRLALDKELDTQLATGELFEGERARFPEPMPAVEVNRPWQFPIGEKRTAPSAPSLGSTMSSALRRQRAADPAESNDESNDRFTARCRASRRRRPPTTRRPSPTRTRPGPRSSATSPGGRSGPGSSWSTGSGRSSPARPCSTGPARSSSCSATRRPRTRASSCRSRARGAVRDPVIKSNIDFSGETFPVIQVGCPRRSDVADERTRGRRSGPGSSPRRGGRRKSGRRRWRR